MYTIPLTSAWIFDRCQEIARLNDSYLGYFLFLIVVAVSCFLLIRKKCSRMFTLLTTITITFLASILYIPLGIFLGYVVVNCAASDRYWTLLEPAISLNSELNHRLTYNYPLPQNQEDLKKTFPQLYGEASKKTKLSYYYDKEESFYFLIARPSSYSVHVFDSRYGRVNYSIGWASFFRKYTADFKSQSIYNQSFLPR